MKRLRLIPAAELLALSILACTARVPILKPDGSVNRRNLMHHIKETYGAAWRDLAEGNTGAAYQRLALLEGYLKTIPAALPAQKDVKEAALNQTERALAALRLGDIFAARDATRLLSVSCKSCHALGPADGAQQGRFQE